jgi:fatty acid desaturase
MNEVHSTMISFFYGYPAFGWIPTHNENHHRYNNREGDATITWRGSHANTLGKALLYFFVSTRHQAPLIANYLKKARKRRGGKFGWLVFQYVSVFGGHACAAALAIHLHGWSRGLFVYASALGIPAFGALWGIMFTNYLQHVDCDAWSTWNHSRNFVSPWMNFFVFENGFHTVHHERPGLHWSLCRAEHERIAANVDPRLNENSIFGYCFKTYVLAYFSRRFASVQVGRPSYETPTSTRADDVAKAVSEEEFVPAE